MGTFFPSNSHPMVYFIIWEMQGFPRQFPINWENGTKSILWKEPGKLVTILFTECEKLSSIRFRSYVILHHMWNEWVFPWISQSMSKCNKTHPMGETWHMDTHTYPKVWLILYHQISPLFYIIWEMIGFSHQFLIAWGNAAKSLLRERPEM